MKKIVSTFAFALLVGGLTFADDMAPAVKIGAWGRGFFVPVFTGGTDGAKANTQSLLGTSWGGAPRIGFTIAGDSANVGFQADLNLDNFQSTKLVSMGDQQKIWVKPVDGLTLSIGNIFDDTLRGNGTFGSFDWLRLSWTGEDFTFTRVAAQSGFEASYAMDALYVYVANSSLATPADTNKVFAKTLQIGGGYTIKDIGTIRAQAIGVHAAKDYQVIEAAFKLTAVQNLYVDLGIHYPTDNKLATDANNPESVNLYGNYTADKAKIHGLFSYKLPAKTTTNAGKAGMEAGAGVDYSLDGGLGVGADFRFKDKNQTYNGPVGKSGLTGFFAGVTKGFSNGLVGVGIEYSNTSFAPGYVTADDSTKAHIALPVRFEYWF